MIPQFLRSFYSLALGEALFTPYLQIVTFNPRIVT